MAGFTQWRAWAAKKDVRKVVFVCGDEPLLIERVVEDMRAIVSPPVTDYLVLEAGTVPDSAIWVEALHTPLDPEANRLVVVRSAERFQDWAFLPHWLLHTKNSSVIHIVFVSNESDFPTVESEDGKSSLAEHIQLIQSKGRAVRCVLPADDDLANWLVDEYDLSYESADFLVRYASGNLHSIINVARKSKVLSSSPKPAIIAQLCEEEHHDSFVDSLILGDKKSALRAIADVDLDDYSSQIGLLNSRLELIQDLSVLAAKRLTLREICGEQGMKPFLVRKFLPCTKRYSEANILYRRKLLVSVDHAIQSGARKGVLEALVAMW